MTGQWVEACLIDCTSLFCTIACEKSVAGHSCGSILVDSSSTPGRVGGKDTRSNVTPESVLEQPSTTATNFVAGESAIPHSTCNQLMHDT